MKKAKLLILAILLITMIVLPACSDNPDNICWKWVVECQYKDILFVGDNLLVVQNEGGKYAVMDLQEKMLVPFQYDSIDAYSDGLFVVSAEGEFSYIDSIGNVIITDTFEEAYSFSEKLAAVKKEELWGYIDLLGNLIVPYTYEECQSFMEGMAAVNLEGKWGFINSAGDLIVLNQYDEVKSFCEGRAAVRVGDKWGFIDTYGNQVTECIFDDVRDFQDGYAAVMMEGKWGFVSHSGDLCIECHYDEVGDFSEQKAAVRINDYEDGMDEWAYINPQEEIVIDFYPYDASEGRLIYVGEFQDEIAFVSRTLYCVIDEKGNNIFGNSEFFISAFSYNSEYDVIPGYVYTDEAMTIRKYGLVGLDGTTRIEPVFDYVEEVSGRYVIVGNIVDGQYQKGVIELKNN